MLSPEDARRMAEQLVARAVAAGADACDALYVGDRSNSVQVRLGELEHVDSSEGERIGVRLFVGSRSASVASSDFAEESLRALVERGMAMAAEAPEDPWAGLAPEALLHTGPDAPIDSVDTAALGPEQMRAMAVAAEKAAMAVDGVTNSSGGSSGSSASVMALATSDGFSGAYSSTGYSCSASVIAGEGSGMQRDYASHAARHLADLDPAEEIGRLAGERAVARMAPVRPRAGRMAVLFDPRVSNSLLGHFVGAVTGSSIARKASFLQDKLGEQLFRPDVTIVDDPLRPRGLRSRPFDAEGVRVHRKELVSGGVLNSWIADSAAARQLGIDPTGNAVRSAGGAPGSAPGNLVLMPGTRSREELLGAFPEAILVTELIGMGVNGVTGDYSRGAAGFLVRDGEIASPVAEITIASNLIDMFASLEPGSDLELRRGIDAPTILIPEMTVAAA
jgi:PmbA protein